MFVVVRHRGQKGVINIKDPCIFTITFQSAAAAHVELGLFNGPLGVSFVLGGCHVFLDVLNAFLGHNIESPDVVYLNIDPPTLTVILQA